MNATAIDTRAAWRAPSRTGYDASPERTVARVLPLLAEERVVWLSTVSPDGAPHLVPTWFWWDGSALVVFSKPDAVKVRNLRANPRLMVALGHPEDDFAVGLIEAEASCGEGRAHVPDAFFDKYADELGRGRLDPQTYRTVFTQEIRIVPTRFLAWHGRAETRDELALVRPPRPASRVAARLAAVLDGLSTRLRGVAAGPVAIGAAA